MATENNEMRERIQALEFEKVEMRHKILAIEEAHVPNTNINAGDMSNPDTIKMLKINEANEHLEKRIAMLQKRE